MKILRRCGAWIAVLGGGLLPISAQSQTSVSTSGDSSLVVSEGSLYVLKGKTLYKYDAYSLKLQKQTTLGTLSKPSAAKVAKPKRASSLISATRPQKTRSIVARQRSKSSNSNHLATVRRYRLYNEVGRRESPLPP